MKDRVGKRLQLIRVRRLPAEARLSLLPTGRSSVQPKLEPVLSTATLAHLCPEGKANNSLPVSLVALPSCRVARRWKGDRMNFIHYEFDLDSSNAVEVCLDKQANVRLLDGSNFQRWIATQVGSTGFFTWTNRATHRILTAHAKGAQLTTSAPTATPAGTQQWKFSS